MIYNPAEIEEELLSVQRNVSPTEARTSLFNVVVFSNDSSRTDADRAVGHLLGRRPARVVQVRPTDGDESDIRVSARCLLDQNQQSVCIQEVVIDAAGRAAAPGLWSPVVIRDIPVYVLWLDEVIDRQEDLLLAWEQADEVIIDSESGATEELGKRFRTLLDAHAAQNMLFADLAWRRLTPFRESVAELFDTPEALGLLGNISRVSPEELTPTASVLFTNWLASRLNWTPDGGDGFRDPAARRISVDTATTDKPDLASAGVTFETTSGETAVARADGLGCIHLQRPDGSSETRVYSVPSIGEALLAELDDRKVDNVYLETVKMIAERSL